MTVRSPAAMLKDDQVEHRRFCRCRDRVQLRTADRANVAAPELTATVRPVGLASANHAPAAEK